MMFYKETNLKETQIGKIPHDWKSVLINQISEVRRGASPRPIGDPKYFSDKGRGWIRISDVTETYKYLRKTSQYLSELGESRSVKVDPGDLIMSICATIGRPILVDMEACIHDGFVVFRNLSKEVDTEFLFYVLQKYERKFASMRQTGTQGNLNTNLVGSTPIPVPSLSEQRGIVGVLGVVDSAVELVDRVIAKTERLKKGLMQTLLTRGIGHKEYKQTPIGTTPIEWEITRIEDIAETSSGGTPSRSKKEYFEGNIPWVKSGELKDNIIYDTDEKITTEGLQNSAAKIFPKGTLLIAMYGATVGKTGILGLDAATNQAICAILPKDDTFDARFLRYYVVFRREQMIAISAGGAQPNISQEIIRSTRIALPPLSEQQRIAEILSVVDKKLEFEKEEKARLERVKRGLMDLLLTGKIRVKVD